MSGEEKATQLGQAVAGYQEARQELAHLDTRLESVFSTYREVGSTMDRARGSISPPKIGDDGRLVIGYTASGTSLANLLNLADLRKLVEERQEVEKRVKQAEEHLRSLGFNAFESYSFYKR